MFNCLRVAIRQDGRRHFVPRLPLGRPLQGLRIGLILLAALDRAEVLSVLSRVLPAILEQLLVQVELFGAVIVDQQVLVVLGDLELVRLHLDLYGLSALLGHLLLHLFLMFLLVGILSVLAV